MSVMLEYTANSEKRRKKKKKGKGRTATTGYCSCTRFIGGFSSCHGSEGIKNKSAAHINEG